MSVICHLIELKKITLVSEVYFYKSNGKSELGK